MKKSTHENNMTVDDLAEITARQFDRVDKRFDSIDDQFEDADVRFGALRAEMILGFANADRKLELKTGELRQDISRIDEKIDTVIQKLDSVIDIVKDHEYRLNGVEDTILELKTV